MTQKNLQPLTYSIEGVSEVIGVKRTTIYKMLKTGELKSVVIGGRRLIPRSEVDRLLKNAEQNDEFVAIPAYAKNKK
jgi:excisionase family DNA binding protein